MNSHTYLGACQNTYFPNNWDAKAGGDSLINYGASSRRSDFIIRVGMCA